MSQKNIIMFMSPSCEYSQEILRLMTAKNIKDYFVIVNVDNASYKIPSFVNCTPMLFIRNKGEIVVDENIKLFINAAFDQQQQHQQHPQHPQPTRTPNKNLPDISESEPMVASADNRGFYSYIEDDKIQDKSSTFEFLRDDPLHNPQNKQEDMQRSSKFDSKALEQYTAQRLSDVSTIFKERRI
jgi:glutaredoxin